MKKAYLLIRPSIIYIIAMYSICVYSWRGGVVSSAHAAELLNMTLIRAGTFWMGNPSADEKDHEGPPHKVKITRDFYMGKTEVTQGQWKAVIGNNPSRFSDCGNNCPVESVNWFEACTFANALSRREGLEECYELNGCNNKAGEHLDCTSVRFKGLDCQGYRLPTEAEWEYACRAGTNTKYYAGDSGSDLARVGWYGKVGDTPHPVGTKSPNAWGLYDMHGNVAEWCWDRLGDYSSSVVSDPTGPNQTGPEKSFVRMIRGGDWFSPAKVCSSYNRSGDVPGPINWNHWGFRLVKSSSK